MTARNSVIRKPVGGTEDEIEFDGRVKDEVSTKARKPGHHRCIVTVAQLT